MKFNNIFNIKQLFSTILLFCSVFVYLFDFSKELNIKLGKTKVKSYTKSMFSKNLEKKSKQLGGDVNNEFNLFSQINHGYPNMMQAPNRPAYVNQANFTFTAPPLSRAFMEMGPTKNMKISEFLQEIRYVMYNLTRGETEQMFYFADKNKNDVVSQEEWDSFAEFYIYPFEACDNNTDYLLDEAEFKVCFEMDPNLNFVNFSKEFYKDWFLEMMSAFSTRSKALINFADYLLMRKALFGWKECESSASFMAKEAFQCALRKSLPIKYHLNSDINRFYEAGLETFGKELNIQFDFIIYLRTFYFANCFVAFSSNNDIPYIQKQSFLKSIKDDRIPQNFEEKEVIFLYDLQNNSPTKAKDNMDVPSFFFFFNLHRLLNLYSVERPLLLSHDEFILMINDRYFPAKIRQAIDVSLTMFAENIYQEASLILQTYRPSEKEFFYKFKEKMSSEVNLNLKKSKFSKGKFRKQDASAVSAYHWNTTIVPQNYSDYDINQNETMRTIFFTIPTGTDKRIWTKEQYYRTIHLAHLYTHFVTDSTFLVPVTTFHEKLYAGYDEISPPMNMKQRVNYALYKNLPSDVRMDLFIFMNLELWTTKFNSQKLYSNRYIEETDLKIILGDFGFRDMPDTVIDSAKIGFDRLRRRIYNPKKVIIAVTTVSATAGELVRKEQKTKKYNLKRNFDWGRKYPNWNRRFHSSPHI